MIRYGSTGWFQLRKVSVDWARAEDAARRITARTRRASIVYLRATAFWVDGAGAVGSTEGMAARNSSFRRARGKRPRPVPSTIKSPFSSSIVAPSRSLAHGPVGTELRNGPALEARRARVFEASATPVVSQGRRPACPPLHGTGKGEAQDQHGRVIRGVHRPAVPTRGLVHGVEHADEAAHPVLDQDRLQAVHAEGLPRFVLGFDEAVGEQEEAVPVAQGEALLLEARAWQQAEGAAGRLEALDRARGPDHELRVVPGVDVTEAAAPAREHRDEERQVRGAGGVAREVVVEL